MRLGGRGCLLIVVGHSVRQALVNALAARVEPGCELACDLSGAEAGGNDQADLVCRDSVPEGAPV